MVVVGSFNPAIFHPEWFLRQKLIGDQDAKDGQVKVVSSEFTDVQLCGLKLFCMSERLSLGTSNISQAARLQDLHVAPTYAHHSLRYQSGSALSSGRRRLLAQNWSHAGSERAGLEWARGAAGDAIADHQGTTQRRVPR